MSRFLPTALILYCYTLTHGAKKPKLCSCYNLPGWILHNLLFLYIFGLTEMLQK